jgi:hypothetical protein
MPFCATKRGRARADLIASTFKSPEDGPVNPAGSTNCLDYNSNRPNHPCH